MSANTCFWLLARALVLVLVVACGSAPARGPNVQGGRLKVHDDLGFTLTKSSKLSQEPPVGGFDILEIRESLAPGETLSVRLVTKILDERERATLAADPNAIGEVWPSSLELRPTTVVRHISERAWEALDYDPSGIAHEDFEGGHSTYATPAKITLHVAFVHHGALIVVHATVELDPPGPEAPDEATLLGKYRPLLERTLARLGR